MIHIVTSDNRHLYGPQLQAMHEQRRLRCVEKSGRDDLVRLDGGEIDDHDDARAIHLLGFNDAMELEMGLRLRPTNDHGMLVDGPDEPPRKVADIWEAGGITPTCRRRKGGESSESGERVFEVWAAAMELALAHGITHLVGRPHPYACGVAAGSEIAVSRALLDRLLVALGRAGPVGYHIDAMDMIAFADLGAVQRQVERAMTPQLSAGAERDEVLAAETLFSLHDMSVQVSRIWARPERALPRPLHA